MNILIFDAALVPDSGYQQRIEQLFKIYFSVNPPLLSAQQVPAVADFVLVLEKTEMLKIEIAALKCPSIVRPTYKQRNTL